MSDLLVRLAYFLMGVASHYGKPSLYYTMDEPDYRLGYNHFNIHTGESDYQVAWLSITIAFWNISWDDCVEDWSFSTLRRHVCTCCKHSTWDTFVGEFCSNCLYFMVERNSH